VRRWNVAGLARRTLTWEKNEDERTSIIKSALFRSAVCVNSSMEELLSKGAAGRFQSSVGMAWHGLLARPAEEVLFFLQFQGATGTEAPSHGCRAARLLCVFV
jgi:hypothetical protein